MEESRLLQGLGLSLLHILFLQVSVLLVHNILAELWAHVSDTHINVCIKLLRLDQAIHELSLLLVLTLSHDGRFALYLRIKRDARAYHHGLVLLFLRHVPRMHDADHLRTSNISKEGIVSLGSHD